MRETTRIEARPAFIDSEDIRNEKLVLTYETINEIST